MSEYLELKAYKFTFKVAIGRYYSPEGVWVMWAQPEAANRVRVGLTDFLQQHNGDVAFLSVKPPRTRLQVGDELAEIETVKVTLTVASPVGGTILEVNGALDLTPEVVNEDPYGDGWLAVIEAPGWETDRAKLLDAGAYLSVVQSLVEQETKNP
jgi:glycine cleavage system H protein